MPLALMALVGTLGFNFQVVLPLLAKFSFGGGAGDLRGAGLGDGRSARSSAPWSTAPTARTGAAADRRRRARLRRRARCSRRRCRRWPSRLLVLAVLGAAAVTFAATINSTLQLAVSAEMRGRVMALYSVVFLGSTPIGGPLAGWLSQAYDPRVALLLAGVSGLSAAWAAHVCFARIAASEPSSASGARPESCGSPARGSRTLPAFVRRALSPAPYLPSRCSRPLRGTPRRLPSASPFRVRPGRRAPA